MPTGKQIATTIEHIKDVIGRNYIEGDGDMCSCVFQPEGGGPVGVTVFQGIPVGTPEPFADLPSWGKAELLMTYVSWQGFSDSQCSLVHQRVIDGKSPDTWMDGIDVTKSADHGQVLFKQILAEQKIDYHAAGLRDTGEDYKKFLKDANERALDRMLENEGNEGNQR